MLLGEAVVPSVTEELSQLARRRTKRACFKHETTSDGRDVDICGLVVVADACQLSGGCDRSAMLPHQSWNVVEGAWCLIPDGEPCRGMLSSSAQTVGRLHLEPLVLPTRFSVFPAFLQAQLPNQLLPPSSFTHTSRLSSCSCPASYPGPAVAV